MTAPLKPDQMLLWNFTKTSPDKIGGVEKHILGLNSAFKKLGVTTYEGLDAPTLRANHSLLILHSHGDIWATLKAYKNFKSIKESIEALWVHIAHGNTVARIIAGKEYLSLSGWKGALRDHSLMLASDACIAVSEHARTELMKFHRYSKPCVVVENGVDSSVFTPVSTLTSKDRVLFLGRSEDRVKNAGLFLQAMDIVALTTPALEVEVAPGLREIRPYLRNVGTLNPQDVARKLRESKVLVLSSFYEGDPLVVREAMATGICVVATDLPATRSMLSGYAHKKLVPLGDPKALAKATTDFLSDKSLSPTTLTRDWNDVAFEYLKTYQNLLHRKSNRKQTS